MPKSRFIRIALVLCLAAVLPFGCAGPEGATSRPTSQPVLAPLPPEALWTLQELSPELKKTVNAPAQEVPPKAVPLLAQAEQFLAGKDYAFATERLERAAAVAPNHPRILRDLGLAYAAAGDYSKALDNFRKAVALRGDDLHAQLWIARLCLSKKENADALTALRTALLCSDAAPDKTDAAEALLRLARLLEQMGYYQASLECYARLETWVADHGYAYDDNVMLREYALQPERLLTEQGKLLLELRRPDKAVEILQKSFARDRTNIDTARLLVQALIATGNYSQAEKTLVDAGSEPTQLGQVAVLSTRLIRLSGDKQMPLRIWKAYKAKNSVSGELATSLARAALDIDAAVQAETILNSLLESMPGNAPAARALAKLYAREGKSDQALRLFARMIVTDPEAVSAAREGSAEIASAAGRNPQVLQAFADAARADKSDARYALLFVAATLAQQQKNYPLAAELYAQSSQARADFEPAYESLFELYALQKRPDLDDRLLAELAKNKINPAFVEYLRGRRSLLDANADAAIEHLEKSRELDKNRVATLLLLADAYIRAGKLDNAAEVFKQVIEVAPEDERGYRRLFELFAARKQYPQAQMVLARLFQVHPRSVGGRILLAELQLIRGERDEAVKILQTLLVESPDNLEARLLLLRAQLAGRTESLSKEQFDSAIDQLGEILRQDPQNGVAKRMLAELLSLPGRHDDALAAIQRLYRQTNHQIDIAQAYVVALLRAKNFAAAESVLRELLADDPNNLWARQVLLETLSLQKRSADAIAQAEEWLSQAGDESSRALYRQKLLRLYEENKQFDKAQRLLDEWIPAAKPPELAQQLRMAKLRFYGMANQPDRAIAYLQAEDNLRNDISARQSLLAVLSETKSFDKSQRLLDAWLARNPSDARLRQFKLLMYGQADDLAAARAYADQWIAAEPLNLLPRQVLIGILSESKKYNEALRIVDGWLREAAKSAPVATPTRPAAASAPASAPTSTPATVPAVASAPTTASAPASRPTASRPAEPTTREVQRQKLVEWLREASLRLLITLQDYDTALERASKYVAAEPENMVLRTIQSSILMELGRQADAAKILEVVLKAQPDDPQICNDLGYLYADMGVNLTQAEKLVRSALAKKPDEVNLQDSLGWVFYKQGRFRDAAAVFDQVLRGRESEAGEQVERLSSVMYDHAGDVYYRLGANTRAVDLWKTALNLAGTEKPAGVETRRILRNVPLKIQAVSEGKTPPVATVPGKP